MGVLSSLAAASGYYTTTTSGNGTDGAAIGAFLGAYFIFIIVLYIVFSFIMYKVFSKAGRPGWAAFVPLYNIWVLYEIGGKPGWLALLVLIPFVGPLIATVMSLLVSMEIAKRFGKSPVFGVVALWLFSIVGYAILAFDGSTYNPSGVATASSTGTPPPPTPQNPTIPPTQSPPPLVQ